MSQLSILARRIRAVTVAPAAPLMMVSSVNVSLDSLAWNVKRTSMNVTPIHVRMKACVWTLTMALNANVQKEQVVSLFIIEGFLERNSCTI